MGRFAVACVRAVEPVVPVADAVPEAPAFAGAAAPALPEVADAAFLAVAGTTVPGAAPPPPEEAAFPGDNASATAGSDIDTRFFWPSSPPSFLRIDDDPERSSLSMLGDFLIPAAGLVPADPSASFSPAPAPAPAVRFGELAGDAVGEPEVPARRGL